MAQRWSGGSYITQLFTDVDANHALCYRYRDSGGTWGAWKRVPMGDGTGASGTWGINISGSAGNANTVGGYGEGSFFRARGDISVNYVDLTTYSANTTNYQNPANGIWRVNRGSYSAGLITFTQTGASASGLDIYFHYAKGNEFKFRRRIDSNRLSGAWESFITSENISSQSVSYASSAGSVNWTGVASQMQGGNEFNIPDSGFGYNSFWFNYYPRNARSANSTLITNYYFGNLGTGYANLNAANYYTTSDRSKKQNISSLSEHIRKFQLKDTEKWHYGVIAQEVEEMFREGEEGNMTVNYNSVLSYYVGLLENKVSELSKTVKQQSEEIDKLKSLIR